MEESADGAEFARLTRRVRHNPSRIRPLLRRWGRSMPIRPMTRSRASRHWCGRVAGITVAGVAGVALNRTRAMTAAPAPAARRPAAAAAASCSALAFASARRPSPSPPSIRRPPSRPSRWRPRRVFRWRPADLRGSCRPPPCRPSPCTARSRRPRSCRVWTFSTAFTSPFRGLLGGLVP